MPKTRKKYTAEFKAQVVLELLSEKIGLSKACEKYKVNPQVIARWKAEFIKKAPKLFETKDNTGGDEEKIAELERKEMIYSLKSKKMEQLFFRLTMKKILVNYSLRTGKKVSNPRGCISTLCFLVVVLFGYVILCDGLLVIFTFTIKLGTDCSVPGLCCHSNFIQYSDYLIFTYESISLNSISSPCVNSKS